MANVKISELPTVTSILTSDIVPTVTGGVTSKIGVENLVKSGLSGGTANGVLYLNGSKAATSGSALTFDGNTLANIGAGDRAKFGSGTRNIYIAGDSGGVSLFDGAGQTGNGWYISGLNSYIAAYLGSSEQMRLNTTGMGIGTNNPTVKLHTVSSGNTPILSETTGGVTSYLGLKNTGGMAYIASQNNNILLATSSNADTRVIISADGTFRVKGAGTAGSTDAFQVSGSAPASAVSVNSDGIFNVYQTNNSFGLVVKNTSSGVSGAYGIQSTLTLDPNTTDSYFYKGTGNTTDRFVVRANGNVANTNNSYGAISDIKLKENIVNATPKLESLNQVRVVNYNFIGEDQKQLGVIAQELEQVFPSIVEETIDRDADGNDLGTTTKSVKYSVFVPMLIKAIQELKAELDELKSQLGK